MKDFRFSMAAIGFATAVLTLASCNDQSGTGAANDTNSGMDTNLVDSRRNSTDTVNYLTKDSGNQSQDVIDHNPPDKRR